MPTPAGDEGTLALSGDRRSIPTVFGSRSIADPAGSLTQHRPSGAQPRRPRPQLDRYRIERLLGEGAMGQVWQAHDPALGRAVAVKLVHGDTGASGQAQLERLAREARALARVSHPNVVGVFDVGTYPIAGEARYHGLYIVMELVVGPTLAQWLDTPRSVEAIVEVFVQAAQGLAAAHDGGLVHRDFKPANVLVGDDGRVRVGDFGLARRGPHEDVDVRVIVERLDAQEMVGTLAGSLTDAGIVMGTPVYMAPEQHRGEAADASSDQYAFCVALYEAVAGVRPFVGDIDRTYAAKCARLLRPPAAGRQVPRRLLEVVMRGLAPDRDERWPSMRALIAELQPPVPKKRAIVMAVGAVLASFGLVGLWSRSAPDTTCPDRARIDAAWDEGARRGVVASVTEASSSELAARVTAGLDGQVVALREALAEHCSTTPTAAAACLRDVTTQLVTTIEVLVADERAAGEAMASVAALPMAASCTEATVLENPSDPRLVAARDRETIAEALWNANQPNAGLAAALEAREQAQALGDLGRPMAVRLSYRIASMHELLGEIALARLGFHDAYFAASELADHGTAAMAAMRSALLEAEAGDLDRAAPWGRDAEASFARAQLPPCEAHQFRMYRAALAGVSRDFELGVRLLSEVVEECRATGCGERCVVAAANLAQLLSHLGRDDEALAHRREIVAQYLELRGPESLPTAESRVNLAGSLQRVGALDEALTELDQAMVVLEHRGGAGHPRLASAYMLRSQILRLLGDADGAVAAGRRAVAIGALHSGPDSPGQIGRLITLANALGDAGDRPGALAVYDRVLADAGDLATEHALVLLARGFTRMEVGDLAGAVEDARRGRAVLERLAPYDAVDLTLAYQNEADALARSGACAQADQVFAAGIEWAAGDAVDGAQRELAESRSATAATCRPP